MQLYWTSLSIPKEIVPTVYLYYPQYVGLSPYQVNVLFGPSIPSMCTATGQGLFYATVGKLATINLVSRDNAGNPLDNVQDVYQLYLTGPGATITGDLHFSSSYVGSVGNFIAYYTPIVSGNFVLTIKL
jgi:hypothetical protein